MMKRLLVLLIFSFFCTSSFAQMGSKPTFPEGESSRQEKLPDTVVVLCTSINEETREEYIDTLCGFYKHPKLRDVSPSLFTKENVKDVFVLLTQIDSNKLLVTDTDYSLLKFLRLKTALNNLSFSVFDSTEYFVNNEKYRVISWDEGIPLKIYENESVYSTKFYDWREFWECGEKMDYAPALPYAIPIPTSLIRNLDTIKLGEDYFIVSDTLEWIPSNFVFSMIPLNDEGNEWLDELKGSTFIYFPSLNLGDHILSGLHIQGEGIDLNGDNIRDAFWYVEKGSGNLIEWYARLYLNIDGEWTPIWFQYFNEFY
ncbi:MAG: hypothetical protein ISS16_11160 [Ignavibacteria bacterium]|nr:hypothetical protein [Ignavibacteria bacterium]